MFPLFFTFHNLRTRFGCDYKLWKYFFQINIFPEWAILILYLFSLNDFSWYVSLIVWKDNNYNFPEWPWCTWVFCIVLQHNSRFSILFPLNNLPRWVLIALLGYGSRWAAAFQAIQSDPQTLLQL